MDEINEIRRAIDEHKEESGSRSDELMVVMGPELEEKLVKNYEKTIGKMPNRKAAKIFGIEIVVRDEIKDLSFGIFLKSCMDHLEEHLEEILGLEEKIEIEEFLKCDLCGHPIAADMFSVEGIAFCPWCKDRNVLEVIEID